MQTSRDSGGDCRIRSRTTGAEMACSVTGPSLLVGEFVQRVRQQGTRRGEICGDERKTGGRRRDPYRRVAPVAGMRQGVESIRIESDRRLRCANLSNRRVREPPSKK